MIKYDKVSIINNTGKETVWKQWEDERTHTRDSSAGLVIRTVKKEVKKIGRKGDDFY